LVTFQQQKPFPIRPDWSVVEVGGSTIYVIELICLQIVNTGSAPRDDQLVGWPRPVQSDRTELLRRSRGCFDQLLCSGMEFTLAQFLPVDAVDDDPQRPLHLF